MRVVSRHEWCVQDGWSSLDGIQWIGNPFLSGTVLLREPARLAGMAHCGNGPRSAIRWPETWMAFRGFAINFRDYRQLSLAVVRTDSGVGLIPGLGFNRGWGSAWVEVRPWGLVACDWCGELAVFQ